MTRELITDKKFLSSVLLESVIIDHSQLQRERMKQKEMGVGVDMESSGVQ